MPPSLPAPTLSDQSGLWACGQREDALPTGPTGATTGDYMIEKCQPCNRSTLSAMYPVEPESDLSPHAGRGGASGFASHLKIPIHVRLPCRTRERWRKRHDLRVHDREARLSPAEAIEMVCEFSFRWTARRDAVTGVTFVLS